MIAPVRPSKEIWPSRTVYYFIPNKHGGGEEGELAGISRISRYLVYASLCWFSIISVIRSLNIQGKVSIAFFLPLFLFDLVALPAFSGTDFTSFEAFSDTLHSGQIRSPLSLRIVVRDFVLVSFTYTVDFSFFIGTTQEESTINCGDFVDPNYFLFCPSYVTTLQSTTVIFMYSSLESLTGEKLRGDVYNTLLFDFAT